MRRHFRSLFFRFRVTVDLLCMQSFRDLTLAIGRRLLGVGTATIPETAARREANEEAGIAIESTLVRLDSFATIPVTKVSGFLWGPEVLVVGEHAFGVRMHQDILVLSNEHNVYLWLPFEDAMAKLSLGQQQKCTLGARLPSEEWPAS